MRQRGRGGLRAFVPDLQPNIEAVAIDKLSLTVRGHWREEPQTRDSLTVDGYFEILAPSDHLDLFRIEGKTNGVVIRSRANARTTLGTVALWISGRHERAGAIRLELKGGNVTRTLHHLLVTYGHHGAQFAEYVARLDPVSFFTHAPEGVPLAFGETDNWISDYAMMHACLGDDPFGTFHPLYVRQLQRMIGWLILPLDTSRTTSDGTSLFTGVPGIVCRIDWGDVRIQQIETYFERRHSHAMGAVRLLATAAIVDFDDAQVWRYITTTSLWAERTDDNLSVGLALRENYKLFVYAKAPDRIRFEVRRKGKGTTIQPSDGVPTPETRLLDMFRHDQTNLLDAAQWRSLGPLMDEHPAPQMSDLVRLCSAVQQASTAHEVNFSTLLTALLEDGGLKPNGAQGWSDALISDLQRAGILYRPNVRRRDHRRPNKRHALRPEYRGLLNLVSRSLLDGHGLIAERA